MYLWEDSMYACKEYTYKRINSISNIAKADKCQNVYARIFYAQVANMEKVTFTPKQI